jgi:hypothetical protein
MSGKRLDGLLKADHWAGDVWYVWRDGRHLGQIQGKSPSYSILICKIETAVNQTGPMDCALRTCDIGYYPTRKLARRAVECFYDLHARARAGQKQIEATQ